MSAESVGPRATEELTDCLSSLRGDTCRGKKAGTSHFDLTVQEVDEGAVLELTVPPSPQRTREDGHTAPGCGHTAQPGHPTALSVDTGCAGQTEGPLLSAALQESG